MILVTTTIKKWGNSSAIRIPRFILEQANLKEESDVEIMVKDGGIAIRAIRKREDIRELFDDRLQKKPNGQKTLKNLGFVR